MGYENVLFNGKSMRNAIITKLSEDKHLTSALFANSNITILIDILSYMYQCLMSNLRQAASESMWSDTIFFENANRLARLIGYYAKGQIPFTLLAKLIPPPGSSENVNAPDFGEVTLSYGPYEYRFAVVEHDVNHDQSLVRLALGEWKLLYNDKPNQSNFLVSDGSKFQEFIVERNIDNEDMPAYISQKYVRVFTKSDSESVAKEWKYSPDPLFLIQDNNYTFLDADSNGTGSRTIVSDDNSENRYFNFYINENGDYVIKFGDGLSTAIPKKDSRIYIFYISSTETEASITQNIKSAIANSSSSTFSQFSKKIDEQEIYDFFTNLLNRGTDNLTCLPITTLSGYRKSDTAETIRQNSRAAFSRQNRLVTKEDYKSFLLENFSEWVDITVQNNWEYISSFYGWLYAIQQNLKNKALKSGVEVINDILTVNKLQKFNSSDLADANNVYIWVLKEDVIDLNTIDIQENIGIITDTENGINAKFGNSLGAIKDITEHPIFLNALCKRFMPFAGTLDETDGKINFDNPNPFKEFATYFRIHVDSNYATNLNAIKAKTINYFKSYLFDNIKLGKTPNISALIKDLMAIDGVINITTVFNKDKNENIETEQEVNGMHFCTWTDTNNELLSASDDANVGFNLPNIPSFQYFKSAQTYDDFIQNSLKFKVDYSLKS